MKRFFKSAVFVFLFLICFILIPKKIFAQGTFECIILHSGGCIEKSGSNNCLSGYKPGDCSVWRGKPRECQTIHTCLPENVADSCTTKLFAIPCPTEFPVECTKKHQCCISQEICDQVATINYGCDPGTDNADDGITTAIGCIPINNLNEFAGWILSKVVFIASGIAFLLMAFGAFQIITSSGDPKKTQAGKELITSALSGLLFIILSIFLLKLIGVDILKIPGLGEQTLY